MPTTIDVNSFEAKNENGEEVWYYKDSSGHSCGKDRSWRYAVGVGDMYTPNGLCQDGSPITKITYFGNPVRLS